MTSEREALQAIIDANDQPVFALGSDCRYTAFNRAHAEVMRALYGAEIALGGRLTDYQTVSADCEAAIANLEKALAGERVVASASSGEADRQRSFDVVHTPLKGAAGVVVGVVVRAYDVTERRHVEDGLRESEERYRLLFENMLEGFAYCRLLYDEESRPNDLVYVAVNRAFERLIGLENVTGRRVTEVIPTMMDETPEHFDTYVSVVETGEPAEFDVDFTPFDLWLHLSVFRPETGHFVAVFTDVSEAKRTETELGELHERLDLAQRASGAGVWDWDIAGGGITWSSEMFGLIGLDETSDPAGFDAWNGALHPDDLEDANARITKALADHTPLDSEYRIVRPGGEVRWINALGQGFYDEHGEPVRMIGMCVDITARKLADDEIRSLNEHLEQRVRERTRDLAAANAEHEQFVHSIAHDLRSPLRALSGFSDLVRADYDDLLDDTGRDYHEAHP